MSEFWETAVKRFEGEVKRDGVHVPYCCFCGKPWRECEEKRLAFAFTVWQGNVVLRSATMGTFYMACSENGVCPGGKMTIGHGRNLEAIGIDDAEADVLFRTDTTRAVAAAAALLRGAGPDGGRWQHPITPNALYVLAHLCFWIGPGKIRREFPKFLEAMREERYGDAAAQLLYRNPPDETSSKLFAEIPGRTKYLVDALLAEQTRKDES